MADLVGSSQPQIDRLEKSGRNSKNERRLSDVWIQKFCAVFKCLPGELFEDSSTVIASSGLREKQSTPYTVSENFPKKTQTRRLSTPDANMQVYAARAMRVIMETSLKEEMSEEEAELVAGRAGRAALQLGMEEISEEFVRTLID